MNLTKGKQIQGSTLEALLRHPQVRDMIAMARDPTKTELEKGLFLMNSIQEMHLEKLKVA
jgi:hypothetical protein